MVDRTDRRRSTNPRQLALHHLGRVQALTWDNSVDSQSYRPISVPLACGYPRFSTVGSHRDVHCMQVLRVVSTCDYWLCASHEELFQQILAVGDGDKNAYRTCIPRQHHPASDPSRKLQHGNWGLSRPWGSCLFKLSHWLESSFRLLHSNKTIGHRYLRADAQPAKGNERR